MQKSNIALVPTNATSADETPNRDLESARYALLQRLAPAIRHHMAGTFQPILMLASTLERLSQGAEPDIAKIVKHAGSTHGYARSGATSCLGAFTWVAPGEDGPVPIGVGVADCLGLLMTELALREFSVVNKTGDCVVEWPRQALREAFTAALIVLTDAAPSPAEVSLSVQQSEAGLHLLITVQSAGGELHAKDGAYRRLEWRDAELLAAANAVRLEPIHSGVQLWHQGGTSPGLV